jgi:hypothetical protein
MERDEGIGEGEAIFLAFLVGGSRRGFEWIWMDTLLSNQTPKHSVQGRGRVTRYKDFVLQNT